MMSSSSSSSSKKKQKKKKQKKKKNPFAHSLIDISPPLVPTGASATTGG
jgi:hypothetical protein